MTPATTIDARVLRAEFPSLARWTYLNAAGAPPMSRRAAGEGERYYREMAADGDLPWDRWLAEMEEVRRRAAALLHAAPAEVAFTASASHAFTLLAPLLGAPSHVVVMDDEYPSATLPFIRYGDETTFVRSRAGGAIAIDDIEAAIRPDTRAVVTSTVMFRTGFRQDIRALAARCRARGMRLVVDASQSLGAFEIDVEREGIDALASSGYKWLMAGYGIGLLYIRRELLQAAQTPVAGWFSQRDPDAFVHDRLDLKTTAGVLEVGSPNFPGIFALGGALDLLAEMGPAAIEARIHGLTDYLHAALDASGFVIASPRAREQRAGITIVPMADAAQVVARVAEAGVIVAARGAGVRVSLHVFNTEADVDHAVAALSAVRDRQPVPRRPSAAGALVCVDFNGVLDRYEGWRGADHWDAPADGARRFLQALRARGCRTVVFTTRHYRGVWEWLRAHGLEALVDDVTDRKPAADVFVDDHAICFRGDFDLVLQEIDRFTPHWAAGR